MELEQIIQALRGASAYQGQIVHIEELPARRPWYGSLAAPLPRPLQEALAQLRIEQLYVHQAAAIDAVRAGHHVVVNSGTSSGKTLIYTLPALEACLEDWRARVLYISPTKALAQDQLRALRTFAAAAGLDRVFGIYDGDTPSSARSQLRKRASLILTNPDMLHLGILPHHQRWSPFFRHLRYVVLDEAHVYRGVFGSHVGCVLRRLRRICSAYGSDPRFILCSATMANPVEHAELLTGLSSIVGITEDGAPQGRRVFVFWNPPLIDSRSGARRSAYIEAAQIVATLTRLGVRHLAFARTRRGVELILNYTRKILREKAPSAVERIAAYRGGYTPETRRELERGLFEGLLTALVTTNAMELGIDVGDLDAVVMVGYPGTVTALWQQAGRAGRSGRDALAVLVGQEGPLDQYVMHHPREILTRPIESARCDPGNPYILREHLPCAAYELPLTEQDADRFGHGFEEAMVQLEGEGRLLYRASRWFYGGTRDYPAQQVGLRSAGGAQVLIVDRTRGRHVLETISAAEACFRTHPGAIYLHQAETYQVVELDLERGVAWVEPVDVPYYTQPREVNDVRIIRSYRHQLAGDMAIFLGRVRVTQQVVGYLCKRLFTEEIVDIVDLDLPSQTFETVAVWWNVPREVLVTLVERDHDPAGALHAAEHASIALLPLFAMCDQADLGGLSILEHPDTGLPQIFVYDAHPGGVGLTERGFEAIGPWWRATWDMIRECPCEAGCPSCVQSPRCGNNNEPLDKEGAALLLELLLEVLERGDSAQPAAGSQGR